MATFYTQGLGASFVGYGTGRIVCKPSMDAKASLFWASFGAVFNSHCLRRTACAIFITFA
jgi:hypothetical protein